MGSELKLNVWVCRCM